MQLLFQAVIPIILFLLVSCSTEPSSSSLQLKPEELEYEEASDVNILYSDSAIIRVRIISPLLRRYLDKKNPRDEFPEGARVEFFNEHKKIKSWLEANYAIRYDKDGKVVVRDEVELYNTRREKLETPELIWDEAAAKLSTDKFVRIIRPEKGDTIMGFGIDTDQEFTRFEIKRKVSAKLNFEEFNKNFQ